MNFIKNNKGFLLGVISALIVLISFLRIYEP